MKVDKYSDQSNTQSNPAAGIRGTQNSFGNFLKEDLKLKVNVNSLGQRSAEVLDAGSDFGMQGIPETLEITVDELKKDVKLINRFFAWLCGVFSRGTTGNIEIAKLYVHKIGNNANFTKKR